LTNIGTPEVSPLIEKERVIGFLIGKGFAAGGAGVGAGLDVPLGHVALRP
jgi:hypothetical protein